MANAIQSIQPIAPKYIRALPGSEAGTTSTAKGEATAKMLDPMVTETQNKVVGKSTGQAVTAPDDTKDLALGDLLRNLGKENLLAPVAANTTELIDGIVGTGSTPPCSDLAGGARIKAYIKAHPEQKQATIDALADRYWKTCAEDPKHRPALSAAIREAGLTKETGAALDALATRYPNDPNLNPQFDAEGNQTTLSASQQLQAKELPSIFSRKSDFRDAMSVLGNPDTQSLLDRLEAPLDAVQNADGMYGKPALDTLATMTVDDPRWNAPAGVGTLPPDWRQYAIDAAKKAVDPKNAHFLGEVCGGDGQFKKGDMDAWVTNYSNHSQFADGVVESFSQGGIGDCYLLSSLNALGHTTKGREIIQKSMTYNDNTYSIQFAGDPNKQVFKVTQAEVDVAVASRGSSSGDPDVVALELAADKYAQLSGGTIKHGGWPAEAMHLLTGESIRKVNGADRTELTSTLNTAASNPNGFAITVCGGVTGDGQLVSYSDKKAIGAHAFAITAIDAKNQTLTIENPWNTTKPIQMSYQEFAALSTNNGTIINQAGEIKPINYGGFADRLLNV